MIKQTPKAPEIPKIELDEFLNPEKPGDFRRFVSQKETLKDRAAVLMARMLQTDTSAIREELESFEDDWHMYDRFYRIYHLSFKMYHLNLLILRYCELMLACVGDKLLEEEKLDVAEDQLLTFVGYLNDMENPENAPKREKLISMAMERLRRFGFHPQFIQVISDSLACHFYSNERDTWYEHQMKMSSAWVHARQACWATVNEIAAAQQQDRLPCTTHDFGISPEAALLREVWNLQLFAFDSDNEDDLATRVKQLLA